MQINPQKTLLTDFLQRLLDAIAQAQSASDATRSFNTQMRTVIDAISVQIQQTEGKRLPVCEHLPRAVANAHHYSDELSALATAFSALSPLISWQRRVGSEQHNKAFHHGHANTWIVAPQGLLQHSDIVIGASLLAPHVEYPVHQHPPEELYLVMSAGEWFNSQDLWYTPGADSVVHHRPNIQHAMRASAEPLFAIWTLLVDRP